MDSLNQRTRLTGKFVLVTGSASGIGYASVRSMTAAGAHVFAAVRRDTDLKKFADLSSSVTPLILDVTDGNAIRSAAELVADRTGGQGLYGLINNAGYAFACPLEFVPLDQLRQQLEVNVIGQLAVTQAMIPALRAASGRIINVNSISGHIAGPYVGPYAASKHAFASVNDSLRLEMRNFGIRVIQIIRAISRRRSGTSLASEQMNFAMRSRIDWQQVYQSRSNKLTPSISKRCERLPIDLLIKPFRFSAW